jgi:hypothetical protein
MRWRIGVGGLVVITLLAAAAVGAGIAMRLRSAEQHELYDVAEEDEED